MPVVDSDLECFSSSLQARQRRTRDHILVQELAHKGYCPRRVTLATQEMKYLTAWLIDYSYLFFHQ